MADNENDEGGKVLPFPTKEQEPKAEGTESNGVDREAQEQLDEMTEAIQAAVGAATKTLHQVMSECDGIDEALDTVIRSIGFLYVLQAASARQTHTALGTEVPDIMIKGYAEKREEDTTH